MNWNKWLGKKKNGPIIKRDPSLRKIDKVFVYGAFLEAALLTGLAVQAQAPTGPLNGSQGSTSITSASTLLGGYFDAAVTLTYAIGAIVGLIGAVRVYSKWSHGDHDTGKVAAAWFSACIFLVIVASILEAFFGVK